MPVITLEMGPLTIEQKREFTKEITTAAVRINIMGHRADEATESQINMSPYNVKGELYENNIRP